MTTKAVIVNNVQMSAVKMTLVEAALGKRGLALGGGDVQKVARLAAWLQTHTPKSKLADCSTCGGESNVDDSACPFCGDGEVETVPAAPDVPATSGKVAHAAPAATPVPPAPRAVDLVPLNQGETIAGSVVAATPASLDAAVENIKRLATHAAERLWELGSAIVDVFDRSLWKTRRAADGTEKYKAWGQFCEAELGISHAYSLRLMDVAREFSREQIARIGATKLSITLTVPKGPERDRLLGIAPQLTKAQLAVEAKKVTAPKTPEEPPAPARQTGRVSKGGAGTHKAGPPRTGGRKPEKLTVASMLTRVELPLVDATGKKWRHQVPRPFAAEERMVNGVKQRFVVQTNEEGFVVLVVERARE